MHRLLITLVCLTALSAACVPTTSPKIASTPPATARHMVAAANPLAAHTGRKILRAGGSAVDAAIATQMVLSLVEPQSSGIGGGAFLLHYSAEGRRVESYDGRETAPRSARPGMFLTNRKPMKFMAAAAGGTSVGVPGLLRMLELAHRDHGKLPWAQLFRPAITLAENGFIISPRLAQILKQERILRQTPSARGYFYTSGGADKPAGARVRNPALAKTLRAIAKGGADAFYRGAIARAIVKTVRKAANNPGGMSLSDIAAYQAVKRRPLCAPYRQWRVCGMGPPSSGGLAVLQSLSMLEYFDLAGLAPASTEAVHLIGEASALAFADRNAYVADTDFIPVPINGMLDRSYLQSRAKLIDPARSGGKRQPGNPPRQTAFPYAPDHTTKGHSTTHLSIVDADGNAVSMTSSIETVFGSRLMAGGFILNNQLTDFSFLPVRNGRPVANRAAPGKRPRSSMSPTLVLDKQDRLVLAVGSPGGSRIIGYVTKTLIATLDWKLDMQTAIDMPNFLNRNGAMELEKNTSLEALQPRLQALGHKVRLFGRGSGLHGIRATENGLQGGADRRREGIVLGD
jgi:gamma-glutamyltranspeptidase / glutathione hydrolase